LLGILKPLKLRVALQGGQELILRQLSVIFIEEITQVFDGFAGFETGRILPKKVSGARL
jgi:hypothetical protein